MLRAMGGVSILARGICWATSQDPSINDLHSEQGTDLGELGYSLSNLIPGTQYHVRAYATNLMGTSYGENLSFTTIALAKPSITTTTATSIAETTVNSGGSMLNDGGGEYYSPGSLLRVYR